MKVSAHRGGIGDKLRILCERLGYIRTGDTRP
jgi:hypothetical protein